MRAEPIIISICVGFFLLREIMQAHSQCSHYIADIWSWQQNVCLGLLIISLKHMFQAADEGNNFDPKTIKRRLLIATGGMLIAQVIFFLRSTFLPFARFVGGLLLVFNVMVPFFIVSLLLLLAFAYCFRVWVEQEECTNLGKCFMWVLQGFFSGSDAVMNSIDVIFGIIAIVIVLNVVIAIVDEAWTSAAEEAMRLYWDFRLDFMSETRTIFKLRKRMRIGILEKLAKEIDEVKNVKYVDDIRWSEEPYDCVTEKKHYDEPYDWFDPNVARKITMGHSLNAEFFWIEYDQNKCTSKKRSCAHANKMRMKAILKWVMLALLYCVLILLGIVTAGFFWPKNFRIGVLSVGVEDAYAEMDISAEEKANVDADVPDSGKKQTESR